MPGTIVVDQQSTFASPPFVMSVGPRLKFNSTEQDISRDGQRKWSCQVAVSYHAENGMRAQAEVIEVTIAGEDPSAIVQPGMPVQFDRLRVGFSTPEMNSESGRIRGGKPFWQADGVRPFSGTGNGHPVAAGAKAG
jgi:hypothetical protein